MDEVRAGDLRAVETGATVIANAVPPRATASRPLVGVNSCVDGAFAAVAEIPRLLMPSSCETVSAIF